MPWNLRLVTVDPHPTKRMPDKLVVGDMWYAPWYLSEWSHCLGENYLKDWRSKRDPLIVVLPNKDMFCLDSMAFEKGKYLGKGWIVTGNAPLITVAPSINMVGYYHGYIKNGVITDDVEGRKYDADGLLIRS